MATDFYNARAAKLTPVEAVLFIFNFENDSQINIYEVDISKPLGFDDDGRTKVKIKGRGKTGPYGFGGYTGEIIFRYRRTPLSLLELQAQGNFFEYMDNPPSFLEIVNEVYRRTQMTLSKDDFIEMPFDSTSQTGYVLKANPDSWRFEGEINLGMPDRIDLDSGLPIPEGSEPISLRGYDEVFDRILTYRYTNLDLTPKPAYITRLEIGKIFKLADSDIVEFLNSQKGRGDLEFTLSASPKYDLNLFNSEVIYHGIIRNEDRTGYFTEQDRVIILRPSPNYVKGAIGDLYIHYISETHIRFDNTTYTPLWMTRINSTAADTDLRFWRNVEVNTLLSDSSDLIGMRKAFKNVFGINYEQDYGDSMGIIYNGPVRNTDPLPDESSNWQVVVIQSIDHLLKPTLGETKVYYKP